MNARLRDTNTNGWLEAAIAWEVCASLHASFAKGKDALFTTRHADFVKHAADARQKAEEHSNTTSPTGTTRLLQPSKTSTMKLYKTTYTPAPTPAAPSAVTRIKWDSSSDAASKRRTALKKEHGQFTKAPESTTVEFNPTRDGILELLNSL